MASPAIGGWTGWVEYTRIQQESASTIFQEVAVAVVNGDAATAEVASRQLLDDHGGTNYADNAQLLLARSRFEKNDVEGARNLLLEVVNSANEVSTQHVARLRLAHLMLSQQEYEEAIDLLNVTNLNGLDSHYHELRGDAYRHLNQLVKAREEYELSIETLAPNSSYTGILRAKLNNSKVQN